MRWFVALALCLLVPASLRADEAWKAHYERGIAAAEKLDWISAAEAMQKAAAGRSDEDAKAAIGRNALPYLPWYWLGVALLNGGDTAGALDALRRSDSQGVVQKTTYAASFREALTLAQSQKGRSLKDVNDAKKADEAIGRAMTSQIAASAAGALSEEKYRLASQKLRAALDAKKSGTPASTQQAREAALEASALFAAAAQDARARRKPAVVVPPPAPVEQAPLRPTRIEPSTPPAVIPSSPTAEKPPANREPVVQTPPEELRRQFPPQLSAAFRELAGGRFDQAEGMVSQFLRSNVRSADGYMLRGCTRYLRGVIEDDASLVRLAGDDFRNALRIRPNSAIDPRYFSPKLVAYFRSVKSERR